MNTKTLRNVVLALGAPFVPLVPAIVGFVVWVKWGTAPRRLNASEAGALVVACRKLFADEEPT